MNDTVGTILTFLPSDLGSAVLQDSVLRLSKRGTSGWSRSTWSSNGSSVGPQLLQRLRLVVLTTYCQ